VAFTGIHVARRLGQSSFDVAVASAGSALALVLA